MDLFMVCQKQVFDLCRYFIYLYPHISIKIPLQKGSYGWEKRLRGLFPWPLLGGEKGSPCWPDNILSAREGSILRFLDDSRVSRSQREHLGCHWGLEVRAQVLIPTTHNPQAVEGPVSIWSRVPNPLNVPFLLQIEMSLWHQNGKVGLALTLKLWATGAKMECQGAEEIWEEKESLTLEPGWESRHCKKTDRSNSPTKITLVFLKEVKGNKPQVPMVRMYMTFNHVSTLPTLNPQNTPHKATLQAYLQRECQPVRFLPIWDLIFEHCHKRFFFLF